MLYVVGVCFSHLMVCGKRVFIGIYTSVVCHVFLVVSSTCISCLLGVFVSLIVILNLVVLCACLRIVRIPIFTCYGARIFVGHYSGLLVLG